MDSQQTYHFDGTDGRFDGIDMSDDVLPACLLAPLEGPQETDDCEAEVAADSYSYAGLMTMGMRGGSAMAGMGTRTAARRKKQPVLILADDEREAARRQLDVIAVQDFSENTFVDRTPAAPVLGALAGENAYFADSPDAPGEEVAPADAAFEALARWDEAGPVPAQGDPFAPAAPQPYVPVDLGAFAPPVAESAPRSPSYTVPAWNGADEEGEGEDEEGLDEGAYAPLAAHYAQDADDEPEDAPEDYADDDAGPAYASMGAPSRTDWAAVPPAAPVPAPELTPEPIPQPRTEPAYAAAPVLWPEAEPAAPTEAPPVPASGPIASANPAPLAGSRGNEMRAGHALRARVRAETPPEPLRPSLMGTLFAWLGRLFRGS